MKKIDKICSIIIVFALLLSFVPVLPKVYAEDTVEDPFGLHGKKLAIVTRNTFYQKGGNNTTDTSYLSLTDSYNDTFYDNIEKEYNLNRLGGRKIYSSDISNNKLLDEGATFWTFEVAEDMPVDDAKKGNKSSTLGGYFVWYYIYTEDENGNKQYLNLIPKDGVNNAEISSTPTPVAVVKIVKDSDLNSNYYDNNSSTIEYQLWSHDLEVASELDSEGKNTYFNAKNPTINMLKPLTTIGTTELGYNSGLFTGIIRSSNATTKTDTSLMFNFYEAGFTKKTLKATPKLVKPTSYFDAEIKVFNYSASINRYGTADKSLKFYNGNNVDTPLQITKDGYGLSYTTQYTNAVKNEDIEVEPTLDKNGYPVTNIGSFDYLFNEEAVEGKTLVGTADKSGGLFIYENGHYIYDSKLNAAYFNGTNFELYDSIVRPEYTLVEGVSSSGKVDYEADERKGNFLPFNKINNSSLSARDILVTDDGVKSYKLTGKNDGVADVWFGLTLEAEFEMPENGQVNGEDMIFSFNADDIVLVYIDDTLILDTTGINYGNDSYINFKTGEIVDQHHEAGDTTLAKLLKDAGKDENAEGNSYVLGDTLNPEVEHKINVFYVERGGNLSYFKVNTNLQTVEKQEVQQTIPSDEVENPETSTLVLPIIIIGLLAAGTTIILIKKKKANNF